MKLIFDKNSRYFIKNKINLFLNCLLIKSLLLTIISIKIYTLKIIINPITTANNNI